MQALKSFALQYFTREQVREAFGDLRLRETWEIAADRAKELASAVVEVATSEQAQVVYRQILTAIALVATVIALGLWAAAKAGYRGWIKPVTLIAYAVMRDRALRIWGDRRAVLSKITAFSC